LIYRYRKEEKPPLEDNGFISFIKNCAGKVAGWFSKNFRKIKNWFVKVGRTIKGWFTGEKYVEPVDVVVETQNEAIDDILQAGDNRVAQLEETMTETAKLKPTPIFLTSAEKKALKGKNKTYLLKEDNAFIEKYVERLKKACRKILDETGSIEDAARFAADACEHPRIKAAFMAYRLVDPHYNYEADVPDGDTRRELRVSSEDEKVDESSYWKVPLLDALDFDDRWADLSVKYISTGVIVYKNGEYKKVEKYLAKKTKIMAKKIYVQITTYLKKWFQHEESRPERIGNYIDTALDGINLFRAISGMGNAAAIA
jgi:hypothetical protein